MTRQRPRGNIALAMSIILALVSVCFVFYGRLSVPSTGSKHERGRLAMLWLARSALTAGVTGKTKVPSEFGEVVVRVEVHGSSHQAIAESAQGRATVSAQQAPHHGPFSEWTERFER